MEDKQLKVYLDINGLLSDPDKAELLNWIGLPGFEILVKLISEAEYQWGSQIMRKDYSKVDPEAAMRDLIKTQGQREGLLIAVNSLVLWKKKVENQQKTDRM